MSNDEAKNRRRYIYYVFGAVAVALMMFLAFRSPAIAVETAEAERRTIRAFVAEDAKTRLADTYTIDAPFNGTVERAQHEEGDRLKKGDVVARMKTYDLEQQILSLKARIAQAKAQTVGVDVQKPKEQELEAAELRVQEMRDNLQIARQELSLAKLTYDNAEREFERAQRLYEEGAMSESQYDTRENRFRSARERVESARIGVERAEKALAIAQRNAATLSDSVDDNEYMRDFYEAEAASLEAQLEQLEEDLAEADMTSPVNGVILEKYVDDRRVVAAGTELLTIGDMDTIEIECDVLSEEISAVREGAPVEITGKALDDEIVKGRVKRIYPAGFQKVSSLGIEQQRVRVIIGFDNEQLGLRPGVSVDVRIITDEAKDVIAVPERATFRRDTRWHVFVLEGGSARLRPVEVGIRNDDWAEIIDGLDEGETIVAEIRNDLTDGARVTAL